MSHDQVPSPHTVDEAAIAQHELYLSWIRAGFTPEQAFELLKVMMLRTPRGSA